MLGSENDGYCDDWEYLPEGSYPAYLDDEDPMYDSDRIRECMNRCLDASDGAISDQAFFVRTSDKKCACSSGSCDELIASETGYTSFRIVKTSQDGTFRLP